ncbi:MAG: hypothetical protein JNL69_12535 [Bacteroidia bacterium]|nr:hypothetical protein [Bacteroidia bacterium]
MGQKSERTNLASEFYVLATLHRLELEPLLTLGNKKSVDIVLQDNKRTFTIDVKGMASKTCWLLGMNKPEIIPNHFYVLVTYLNKIGDISIRPESYVLTSKEIRRFAKQTKKGYVIDYSKMRDKGSKYKENWRVLK